MFGSVYTTVISAVILANSYDHSILGRDHSILPPTEYRTSWILMIISGLFYTIGQSLCRYV